MTKEKIVSKKMSIEVSQDLLKELFELADMPPPTEVEEEKLKEVIEIIKTKLSAAVSLISNSTNPSVAPAVPSNETSTAKPDLAISPGNAKHLNTILVVDDLGIVTVQLQALFKKLGFEVTVSNELFDAIEKYKTQDFGYTVTDLFIPTEREGFLLVDEIKKLSLLCKLNTKIIVMSASNKKEHKEKCLNRGADHYVEKAPGWQQKLSDIVLGKEN